MRIIQAPLFDFEAFIADKGNDRLVIVLEALPAERLIVALEKDRWTGRKGYSARGLWSAFIAGILYQCHSIAEVARLPGRDKDIRMVCGFSKDRLPGQDALERFLKKLVRQEKLLEECFTGLVERLRQLLPDFGTKLAVDSTDIEAYSNGHRKSPSDWDARWGAKGAGHHGGRRPVPRRLATREPRRGRSETCTGGSATSCTWWWTPSTSCRSRLS